MGRRKKDVMSEETKQVMIRETGELAREAVRGIVKVGDRVVQASLSSPYYSVAAVSLISAMMVRARMIPPETSMIVTGAGLTLLGASTITETIPVISGLSGNERMIDNQYDELNNVSPWADTPILTKLEV